MGKTCQNHVIIRVVQYHTRYVVVKVYEPFSFNNNLTSHASNKYCSTWFYSIGNLAYEE